ncbi:PREDICTED: integrator complex subunit 12-like [Ceratosolen solmsi marchali]|uniref:Integrator complex subunit 12 n=1 Tax=Ceratosolen solmsi marchali TaxID=326594 RepID=A0AAJ6YCH8_9HYME|nr:PREDICTED: integrator complex subunit 12-like [Ceratosolen solmsi marchali]XP_011495178.1 PREDICTED: integrator complex subunit 12-like [Ceratosolen solmsi marchali]XP_011495253.1 PREDICTED: integrator complex subunit 12-like [Ceratosolen solmsi marchali]XP_011495334.1 PREDICTED: integrator complex subunit 12-like [Ceratosolen solmsi marchali]
MTALDLDPQFLQALKLLHSTNKDSVEQLRGLLDEAIKQKYGASKMLSNTLHKKYTLEEPVLSDQSSTSSKRSKSSNSSKHSKSSKNNSPVTIQDTPPDLLQSDDNLADILEDVACVICKGMDVGAKNRLVECVKCGSLYHQECHTPHILDSQVDTHPVEWYCCNCVKTQLVLKERNSPKPVTETKIKESKKSSSSSSKHTDKYKSSSSTNQSQNSNGSNSNSKLVPNIHIVSADRRLKDMIKKAKQDKRSRSTNSGTNKHSSSSSSSSKNSHDKSFIYKNKSD